MKKTVFLCLFLHLVCRLASPKEPVLRYQKFRSGFMVGIFQSYRNVDNDFRRFKAHAGLGLSQHAHRAESRLISGECYRKFQKTRFYSSI